MLRVSWGSAVTSLLSLPFRTDAVDYLLSQCSGCPDTLRSPHYLLPAVHWLFLKMQLPVKRRKKNRAGKSQCGFLCFVCLFYPKHVQETRYSSDFILLTTLKNWKHIVLYFLFKELLIQIGWMREIWKQNIWGCGYNPQLWH